ncbi:cyclase family protein [Methanococcus vannielii]|nr:cyclase family protein [Methanococcus vannielii]
MLEEIMWNSEFINLSHEITGFSYPGDPKFEIIQKNVDKYLISKLTLGSHTSTHVDYPLHVGLENKKFKNIIGNGFCINIKDLDSFFKSNEKNNELKLPKIEVLLINTGFSKHWNTFEYFEMEVSIEKFVQKIIEMELIALGVDCASIGNFETHKNLLSSNIKIIENLNHLEVLENKFFKFLGFPLNVENIDGSPMNAVALI